MNTVTDTAGSLWSGVVNSFYAFMAFIPTLIGALIILAIGWAVSNVVGRLVERLLHSARLEHAVQRAGIHAYLPPAAPGRPQITVSSAISQLAKWFIRLLFIQAAANILNMPQISAIINDILLFIPNLVVAVVFLVVGAFLARWLGALVEGSIGRMGVGRANLFGAITRYAIMGFAVIAALNQIGIATTLVNTLFIGLVASLTLAFGLAFGLGGQGVASEITRNLYDQSRGGSARLRSVNGGSTGTLPPTGTTEGTRL